MASSSRVKNIVNKAIAMEQAKNHFSKIPIPNKITLLPESTEPTLPDKSPSLNICHDLPNFSVPNDFTYNSLVLSNLSNLSPQPNILLEPTSSNHHTQPISDILQQHNITDSTNILYNLLRCSSTKSSSSLSSSSSSNSSSSSFSNHSSDYDSDIDPEYRANSSS